MGHGEGEAHSELDDDCFLTRLYGTMGLTKLLEGGLEVLEDVTCDRALCEEKVGGRGNGVTPCPYGPIPPCPYGRVPPWP